MSTYLKRHQKAVIWAVIISFVIGAGGLLSLDRAGVFSNNSSATSSTAPKFAAIVDSDKISLETLNARATQLMTQYQNLYSQAGMDPTTLFSGASGAMLKLRLESGALSDLIRETIYAQEARSRGIRVSDSAIDAQLATQYGQVLTSNGITEAQLKVYLEAQGQTIESFKASLRPTVATQLLAAALDADVGAGADPTEAELGSYFEKNIATYDAGEQVHAMHILVADLVTAQQVEKELVGGASFADLAAKYSMDTGSKAAGGDLGWFERGQMVAEFEDAAFSMQPGETSEPVKTDYGYHIIRVVERKAAHTPTLAEIRDQVLADLRAENQTTRAQTWYTDVRKTKKVEIGILVVQAFMMQEQNIDNGLAEFERLRSEDKGTDPYLPYYIGQIYEAKASSAATERTTLEAVTSPIPEQVSRIAQLKVLEKENKDKALAAYVTLVEDGQVDEGVLTRILNFDPGNMTAMMAMGTLLAEKGDSQGAQTRYEQVISANPQSTDALIVSGDLAQKDGDYALAKQRFQQALALQARDVNLELKLVAVLLALDDIAGADAMTVTIRQTDPQNSRLVVVEADVTKAKLSRAAAERDTLKAKSNRTAAEETQLAALGRQVDELYQAAVTRYEAAIKAGGSLDLNVKLGETHLLAGKLDAAEKELQAVLIRSPYRADAYEDLAKINLARGQTDKALEQLRTALARSFDTNQRIRLAEQIVKLDATDTSTRLRLAKLYGDAGKWSSALREFDQLIAFDPAMEDAYSGIAKAYVARGEYDSALDYLKRGVAGVKQEAAKIRLYQQVVDTDQADVGTGKPLSSAGLDALIEIAKLDIPRGDKTDARTRLTRVQSVDETYRASEVSSLLEQLGPATSTTPASSL
jgi:parvulin-like peptidyl-prolyl isomerase/Tfp pilus assembly protein PilF